MSHAAVLQAVRDTLQATLEVDAESCEVGFDGKPKASAGEWYYAIHPGRWGGSKDDYDLDESYEALVTVTRKIAFAPQDRYGIAVWLATDGLEPTLRKIIVAIHQNQAVRIKANSYIPAGGGSIVTALQFAGVQPPQLRDWTWFDAPPPQNPGDAAPCGVSQTITFDRCLRCQDIPDMD